jgi:hypothetical protein
MWQELPLSDRWDNNTRTALVKEKIDGPAQF